ncbi:hypothetical protein [Marinitoga sp. 1138]|uniref:hypothetical protein n=1 Tax=Marinitoga sp. 1138 TaxID=1643334 RepID=UPI001585FEB3|nr:hypothetical protein [Marinitoga sp. 1138]NUU98040.1 hypothetical protein [Marinitoga sp. 1138]
MNYSILAILFGLTPLLQYFIKGWAFFGVSLILFIIFYRILKLQGKQVFSFLAGTIIAAEAIALLFGFTNLFILAYLITVAIIFLVAANDEKKIDILKEYLSESGENEKDWNFYHLFFGRGEVSSIEEIGKLLGSILGIKDGKIAFSVQMPNGDYYKRIINKSDIKSYNLYDIKSNQELYYVKIRDLFMPNRRLRTLHKPHLETFCLTIETTDGEIVSFYEEPDVLQKIVKQLDEL